MSSILAAAGLYLLGHTSGNMLFVGAILFGMGVCYFWPTMLGFVSENLPKTGAVGMNLMGAAGLFAVSVYMIFMGGYYDKLLAAHMENGLDEAKKAAGPEIINVTLVIPIVLIVAFAGLFLFMRSKKTSAA